MVLALAAVAATPLAFADAKCTPAQICNPSVGDLTNGGSDTYTISGFTVDQFAVIHLPKDLPRGNAECNVYTPSAKDVAPLRWVVQSGSSSTVSYTITGQKNTNFPLRTTFQYGGGDTVQIALSNLKPNVGGPQPDPTYVSIWCVK